MVDLAPIPFLDDAQIQPADAITCMMDIHQQVKPKGITKLGSAYLLLGDLLPIIVY